MQINKLLRRLEIAHISECSEWFYLKLFFRVAFNFDRNFIVKHPSVKCNANVFSYSSLSKNVIPK